MRKSTTRLFSIFLLIGCFTFLNGSPKIKAAARHDVNLVLAIDCSYSVDSREFRLQVDGIASALISPEVIAAIEAGNHGSIGILIFQWSASSVQDVVIPWSSITSAKDAYEIADKLIATPRLSAAGYTAMGSALGFATDKLNEAPFWSERQVIDMQADGTSTWSRGTPIRDARDHAIANGIVVNGLPILNEVPFLHHYFRNNVIGGPGSFIEIANDYAAYKQAIKQKLIKEIKGLNLS